MMRYNLLIGARDSGCSRRGRRSSCGRRASRNHQLRFPARPVLVVRMLAYVLCPEPLGLVDEGSLVNLGQLLPAGAQPPTDLRIVHLWVLLSHLAALAPRPNHEGIHGALNMIAGGPKRLLVVVVIVVVVQVVVVMVRVMLLVVLLLELLLLLLLLLLELLLL